MEQPSIEHGNTMPQRAPRRSLAADLLARLPSLGAEDNIFYPETDKVQQHRMYNALYKAAKRYNLNIAVRFYADGLRVWKVAK